MFICAHDRDGKEVSMCDEIGRSALCHLHAEGWSRFCLWSKLLGSLHLFRQKCPICLWIIFCKVVQHLPQPLRLVRLIGNRVGKIQRSDDDVHVNELIECE